MKRTPLEVAFTCLAHPSSLLAMAVLCVNDHLLKGRAPGWITGKLSDFAGLYFFPFLMCVAFSAVQPRASVARTGSFGFALVATWFALIKTTVVGNDATLWIANAFFWPVHIVRDPSDVIALVVMVPAWRLWQKARGLELVSNSQARAYFAAFTGALLSIATSRSPNYAVVGFEQGNGEPVARLTDLNMPWHCELYQLAGNAGWKRLEGRACPHQTAPPAALPVTLEDSRDARIVHRTKADRIERSVDAGKTWSVDWALPRGRREYLLKYKGRAVEPGPYDLAFDPAGNRLYVALGTEGLLVRDRNGTWTRESLGPIRLTPFYPTNWLSALAENWLAGAAVALISLLPLSLATSLPCLSRTNTDVRRKLRRVVVVATIWAAITLASIGAAVGAAVDHHEFVLAAVVGVLASAVFAAVLWRRLRGAVDHAVAQRLTRMCIAGTLGLGFVATAAQSLSDYGVLPSKEAGWVLSLLSGAIAMGGAAMLSGALLRRADAAQHSARVAPADSNRGTL